MFKNILLVVALVAVVALGGTFAVGSFALSSYNSIQTRYVAVDQTLSNIDAQYQRRSNLIPNLVETVKGAANFEKSALTDIATARSNAGKVSLDLKNVTQEQIAQYQQAQQGLSGALSRLLIVAEKYPELKSNGNFTSLQAEIAGTENRIMFAVTDYNKAVADYNRYIAKGIEQFVANFAGKGPRPFFKAKEGADVAPVVKF